MFFKLKQNALHWAAKRGLKQMAELLLENGIDFNYKDMAQRTPLDIAKKNEFFEIAQIIEYYQITELKWKGNDGGGGEIEKINLNLKY